MSFARPRIMSEKQIVFAILIIFFIFYFQMLEPFLVSSSAFEKVFHHQFWSELRRDECKKFDDPSFANPSSEMIKNDRLLRKLQTTDGVMFLGRFFSQLSFLLSSSDCNIEKLDVFKNGLEKLMPDINMDVLATKPELRFTPIAMLNIMIQITRFMRVSYIYFTCPFHQPVFQIEAIFLQIMSPPSSPPSKKK